MMDRKVAQKYIDEAMDNAKTLFPTLETSQQKEALMGIILGFTSLIGEIAKKSSDKSMPWIDDVINNIRGRSKGDK